MIRARRQSEARELAGRAIVLTVLLPFGCGYYLSYLFRSVNAMISPRLAADLTLGAGDLGLLTSTYFIAFAAFQVPLGLMLDRYGPRRIQAGLLLIAALGAGMFAVGDDLVQLAFARGLIGLGVSGALMSSFKANVLWWPRERLPLMNGLTTAFGGIGAVSATVPVELLLPTLGWRGLFSALAVITIVVAVVIFLIVPEKKTEEGSSVPGLGEQIGQLGQIYGSFFFWRLAIITAVHTSAFMAYQTLWAGPWLRDVAHLGESAVADNLLLFNVGFLSGVLTSGIVADRLRHVGVRPSACAAGAVVLTLGVEAMFALEMVRLAPLLCFCFGLFGSSIILVYAIFGQHFPVQLAGRVNTAQNMISFLTAFAVQWGIGRLIGLWPDLGGGHYAPEAHRAGFLMLMGLTVVAGAFAVWPSRRKRLSQSGDLA